MFQFLKDNHKWPQLPYRGHFQNRHYCLSCFSLWKHLKVLYLFSLFRKLFPTISAWTAPFPLSSLCANVNFSVKSSLTSFFSNRSPAPQMYFQFCFLLLSIKSQLYYIVYLSTFVIVFIPPIDVSSMRTGIVICLFLCYDWHRVDIHLWWQCIRKCWIMHYICFNHQALKHWREK